MFSKFGLEVLFLLLLFCVTGHDFIDRLSIIGYPAIQSGSYPGYLWNSADNVVDGNLSTCSLSCNDPTQYCTANTTDNIFGWWQVDLKETYLITDIAITFPTARFDPSSASYATNFTIFVGPVQSTNISSGQICYYFSGSQTLPLGEEHLIHCNPKPVAGRYVTIKRAGGWRQDAIALCEVGIIDPSAAAYARNFSIMVGPTQNTNISSGHICYYADGSQTFPQGEEYIIHCNPQPVAGRYVTIKRMGGTRSDAIALCEVGIFGCSFGEGNCGNTTSLITTISTTAATTTTTQGCSFGEGNCGNTTSVTTTIPTTAATTTTIQEIIGIVVGVSVSIIIIAIIVLLTIYFCKIKQNRNAATSEPVQTAYETPQQTFKNESLYDHINDAVESSTYDSTYDHIIGEYESSINGSAHDFIKVLGDENINQNNIQMDTKAFGELHPNRGMLHEENKLSSTVSNILNDDDLNHGYLTMTNILNDDFLKKATISESGC